MTEEFDPMTSYIESESKRGQAAKTRFLNRTRSRIGKWARPHLYQLGLTFTDPMVSAIMLFLIAGAISAALLSKADFANPAVGMPTTIAVFGLGYTGYNIGARSAKRTRFQMR